MKDTEVPTRKGVNVFFQGFAKGHEAKICKAKNFTKRCHLRIQTIRIEHDGSYVARRKKSLEPGEAHVYSSATFIAITRRLPKRMVKDFINYLLKKGEEHL